MAISPLIWPIHGTIDGRPNVETPARAELNPGGRFDFLVSRVGSGTAQPGIPAVLLVRHLLSIGLVAAIGLENLSKASSPLGKGYRLMRHVTRHAMVTCVVLVFLIGQWGCVTVTSGPPPSEPPSGPPPMLTDSARANLGTIRVITTRVVAETHLEGPTSGKGSGIGKGTAGGFLGCIQGGAPAGGEGVVVGILLSPVCALGGGIYGAVAAESSERVEETEATLNKAVVDLNIQEALRDRVFQIAQQETRYPLGLITGNVPSARNTLVADRSSPDQDTDTILEVSVPRFGLESGGINPPLPLVVTAHATLMDSPREWFRINPPLPLVVTAHARLVGVADGTEFYAAQWTYRSGTLKFVDWAANNAQPFRTELERAVQTLAETIVEELFLLYRIPEVEIKSP